MTISWSCCPGIIFLTPNILAVWSSFKSLWMGEKCRCLNYPAQKHFSPSLEKSLGTSLLGGGNGSQQSTNRETQRISERILTGFGSTRELTSSGVHSFTSFSNWRMFQSFSCTEEMQRAQVLAHPKAAEIPFPLDVRMRYWTYCPACAKLWALLQQKPVSLYRYTIISGVFIN